jgi:hypothetical protein
VQYDKFEFDLMISDILDGKYLILTYVSYIGVDRDIYMYFMRFALCGDFFLSRYKLFHQYLLF